MSEQPIDLLTPTAKADTIIYTPSVISALGVIVSGCASDEYQHLTIDFNRYLSSIFRKHPEGYYYVDIKEVSVSQRCGDMLLKCKVSLFIKYAENNFEIINADIKDISATHVNINTPAKYDIDSVIIETIAIDNKHLLSTGHKPKVSLPAAIPTNLTKIEVTLPVVDGYSEIYYLQVPTAVSELKPIVNGGVGTSFDNVTFKTLMKDGTEKVELGLTMELLHINGNTTVTGVKVIQPVVYEKQSDGSWLKNKNKFCCWVSGVKLDDSALIELDMPDSYALHAYVYYPGMNHHPAYPGIWVPYNNWRLKDRYDIQLNNGEQWKYYFTNGGSFTKWTDTHDGPSRVLDEDVAKVRLVPDDEILEEWHLRGSERLKRNVEMFGDALPEVIEHANGEIEFKVRYRRVFEHEQVCADVEPNDVFRSVTHVLHYDEHTLAEIMHLPFYFGSTLYVSAVRYLKGILSNKVYVGLSLIEDPTYGYVGSLNGASYSDQEIDWVIRKLIDVAETLPIQPVVARVTNNLEKTIEKLGLRQTGGTRVNPTVNNKALKKAAKKERTRLRKEGNA